MPLKMSENSVDESTNKTKESSVITNSDQINVEMLDKKVLEVFSIFDQAFERNLLSNCFISFNGGKDCTVILHLFKKYCNERHKNNNNDGIRIIYIQSKNPFKEIEDFINLCEKIYNIKIERYPGKLRDVLKDICKKNPNLNSVIIGSRRSDPYCENLKIFQPTDPDWPPLMRINPLLDWTLKDIWDYIRYYNVEYCSLYDEGYTSLGLTTDTQKNPHLKFVDSQSGDIKYRPAYELLDDNLERAGRI